MASPDAAPAAVAPTDAAPAAPATDAAPAPTAESDTKEENVMPASSIEAANQALTSALEAANIGADDAAAAPSDEAAATGEQTVFHNHTAFNVKVRPSPPTSLLARLVWPGSERIYAGRSRGHTSLTPRAPPCLTSGSLFTASLRCSSSLSSTVAFPLAPGPATAPALLALDALVRVTPDQEPAESGAARSSLPPSLLLSLAARKGVADDLSLVCALARLVAR